jgi:starch synthase
MRILFVASEAVPFAKTGGLADVVGTLPRHLRRLGHEPVVFLPRYHQVKIEKELLPSVTIPLGRNWKFCSIADAGTFDQVRFFLVNYPEYYDRKELYRSGHQDYPDNAERFAMLSLACLEFAKRSPLPPDIIHCHDWQAALVPVYLKTLYQGDPFFRKTRTLLTIHNLAFQGVFPRTVLPQVSLPDSLYHVDRMEFYSHLNFLKGGILFADEISTVSRKYSLEIQTAEFGCGLEGVLASRSGSLAGILNGADYSEWNPETDPLIPARYSMDNLKGKRRCKAALLAECGLEESLERPLVGMVSRLADQKGFDLLEEASDAIVQMGCSLVVLGKGEEKYHRFFTALQQRFPRQVSVHIAYDHTRAHKIEAGADLFLMPSRFEPCGLNQIYSLKYGTVPVVRATGGLEDTIEDYTGPEGGTGFKFEVHTASSLLKAVQRSVDVYRNPELWQNLMRRGMSKDFSWDRSARQYIELYDSLILH